MLLDLHDRVSDILGERFIGMYLYGSLATDEFESERSDIDYVVITDDYLADPVINALESMHRELFDKGDRWVKKLEGAYVPMEIIRRHESNHPPVPTINEGKFYLAPLDSDWIFQRHILRESGRTISGPPLRDFIDTVSSKDLKIAVHDVIDDWWEPMFANPSRLHDPGYQPYAVLSMCRLLYTVTSGELASKSKAATWALGVLPAEWVPLINHALAWHDGDDFESVERTTEFMQYIIELCRRS
ncbi:hypothetical protein AMJ86_04840 [bacterium SM23_57]|nr:MAG: hypothetical protein AMJ86_04840 [bacterium SM23_57]